MQRIEERVAVVTGGASGIGLATAHELGRAGAKVVLADVEEGALRNAAKELEAAGTEAVGVLCDVTDPDASEAVAREALDRYGAIHIAFLNAGVGAGGLSWECPRETWEWVLGVNLWGIVNGIRAFVPSIVEQDEGHVVITASVAGHVAAPFMGPYNASKHAAVALGETLLHEFALVGSAARASVLCPAWVRTRIAESERNRPERYEPADGPTDEARVGAELLQAMLENGLAPADVGKQVVDAIRDERFWIFTHADDDPWMAGVRGRAQSVLSRENPTFFVPS